MIEGIADCRVIKPVLDEKVKGLCQRPYPGQKKGCPNYGKHPCCPPSAPMLDTVLDFSKPIQAVYVKFNLESQRQRMWFKHPKWTKRQAECCLYWQNGLLSFLKNRVTSLCTMTLFSGPDRELTALYRPEANGVNVTQTMADVGIELQWPPDTIVYKIAFVGDTLKGGD